MRLREIYAGVPAKPPLSIEFFPPKTTEGERRFWRNFPTFKSLKPAFCSVTYSTTGVTHNKSVEMVEKIAQRVVAEFDGRLPTDRKILEQLPGIGTATAGA